MSAGGLCAVALLDGAPENGNKEAHLEMLTAPRKRTNPHPNPHPHPHPHPNPHPNNPNPNPHPNQVGMNEAVERAGELGAEYVVVGMPHRGR